MFNQRLNKSMTLIISYALFIAIIPIESFAAGPAITTTTTTLVNTILSGKTPPISSVGKNGDFYIDTKNLMFYGPKKSGLWPLGVSLKGSDGVNGTNGAAGINGKNGVDGVAGKNGINGTNGVAGEKGATGATGLTGATGMTGATGLTGAKGETGLQGLKGDTGAAGAKGDQGIQGIQGLKGDTGLQGAQGMQGFQGVQGEKGLQGDPGVKGDTGLTGAAGGQGAQGIQGVAGATGPSDTFSKIITFAADMSSKTITSDPIVTLPANQIFNFQIIITGFTMNDSTMFNLDLLAPGATPVIDYTVSKSARSNADGKPGYVFQIIGTLIVGGSNSTVSVRLNEVAGVLGASPMKLSGTSLFFRTETLK